MSRSMSVRLLVVLAALVTAGSAPDDTDLSGRWKGSLTLKGTGECPFDGRPQEVTMTWKVEDGSITIDPVLLGAFKLPESWTGTVDAEGNVTLTKRRTMSCFGTKHETATEFHGSVVAQDGTWALEMEAEETWCPQQNCTSRAKYELRRADPTAKDGPEPDADEP